MAPQVHSTGRGGAGNIGEDPNTYVDGDIVREGIVGVSGRGTGAGEYSAGRGGAGNMVAGTEPGQGQGREAGPLSEDVVPEPATRGPEGYENYHTGRGGQGNIHRDEFGGHSGPQKGEHAPHQHHHLTAEALLEKAKHAIGLDKKKEGE